MYAYDTLTIYPYDTKRLARQVAVLPQFLWQAEFRGSDETVNNIWLVLFCSAGMYLLSHNGQYSAEITGFLSIPSLCQCR